MPCICMYMYLPWNSLFQLADEQSHFLANIIGPLVLWTREHFRRDRDWSTREQNGEATVPATSRLVDVVDSPAKRPDTRAAHHQRRTITHKLGYCRGDGGGGWSFLFGKHLLFWPFHPIGISEFISGDASAGKLFDFNCMAGVACNSMRFN